MMKDYVAAPFLLTDRGSRWLMVMGRLKPARPCLRRKRISPQSPVTWNRIPANQRTDERCGYSVLQSPFSLKQDMRPALAILMAAVAVCS